MSQDNDLKFRIGYWFVYNKEKLKNFFSFLLIFVNFVLFIFIVYSLLNNFVLNLNQNRVAYLNLINDPVQIEEVNDKTLPDELQIVKLSSIGTKLNADIFSQIYNPNRKWGATFDYNFDLVSGKTATRKGFIFPDETKPIIDLSVEGGGNLNNMNIFNVEWIRENNFEEIYNEMIDFDVFDIKYISPEELEIEGALPISRVTFTVNNLSAYNYSNPAFIVLLYRSDEIVGVNYLTTKQILSGQILDLEVTWFEKLPSVNRVTILPDINIFDPDIVLDL